MKPPRISLRVNGTRIGDASRPVDDTVQRLPTRKVLVPRANAALLVRDYRDDGNDDNGAAS